MKFAARLINEKGKALILAANERIDIELTEGNRVIERLSLQPAIDDGYDLWRNDEYLVKHYKGKRKGDDHDPDTCKGCHRRECQ